MKVIKVKKETVTILGETVTVGSKKHKLLLAKISYFNDLINKEMN